MNTPKTCFSCPTEVEQYDAYCDACIAIQMHEHGDEMTAFDAFHNFADRVARATDLTSQKPNERNMKMNTMMKLMSDDEREFMDALPEHLQDAGRAYLLCVGDTDPATFEDAYAGEWDSFTEYAAELAEDTGMLAEVPEWARPYFDMDKFAHDLTFDHATEDAPAGGVYVFRSL